MSICLEADRVDSKPVERYVSITKYVVVSQLVR
jgi:hypothetical protein